jgi:O-antigen ligase
MNALNRWPILATGGMLLGLAGGLLADKRPSTMIVLCLLFAAVLSLAMLGDRAFPWAIVLVSVTPWYPFTEHAAAPGGINQKAICSAMAAAPLAPWLWSLSFGGRRTRPSPRALLMGVLFGGLALLIFSTLGRVSKMIDTEVVGYLFIGVAFLCARRFVDLRNWPPAGFAGLAILLLLGVEAAATAPGGRVGYFSGYPITYGALVVGLLPIALLFAYRRSRPLAAILAATTGVMLILSESRSAWIATIVMLLVLVALLARRGNLRALALVGAAVLLVVTLVIGTGSLHKVVEQRLSAKAISGTSVTHRAWSYSYATGQIGQRPLFGAGAPGFAAIEAADRTSIGAIDNGYLSVTVDMGLIGLAAALIPIMVALTVLLRCLRFGVNPPLELALALGIVGMAVVTAFYDSFYWAQIDLMMGAMGGALSVRVNQIAPAQVGVETRGRATSSPRFPLLPGPRGVSL